MSMNVFFNEPPQHKLHQFDVQTTIMTNIQSSEKLLEKVNTTRICDIGRILKFPK
jgi:hypothetical protein